MATNLPRLDVVTMGPDATGKASLVSRLVSYSGPDLKSFVTDSYQVFVTDADSREDLISKISGAPRQISCTILIVSVTDGDFDDGQLSAEVQEQMAIAQTLCAGKLVVLVNQMDAISWDQDRFNVVSSILSKCAEATGIDAATRTIIPVDIKDDESTNLFIEDQSVDWYRGDMLLSVLDSVPKPTDLPAGSLRWSTDGIYKIKGVGDVLTGTIVRGKLINNAVVKFYPTHSPAFPCTGRIFSIEYDHQKHDEAEFGQEFGANVKNLDRDNMPHTGDVGQYEDGPASSARTFTAIVVMYGLDSDIGKSSVVTVIQGKSRFRCNLKQCLSKRGPSSGGTVEPNPETVSRGDIAEVILEPRGPYVVETLADCPALGRFTILSYDKTVGVGSVKDVAS